MRRITYRTEDRLIGLAYDMERLAASLRAEGYTEADVVAKAGQLLGNAGRSLHFSIAVVRGEGKAP